FRPSVSRVFVWMKFNSQLAIRFLDILDGGVPVHSQNFVIIAFRSHSLFPGTGRYRILTDRSSLGDHHIRGTNQSVLQSVAFSQLPDNETFAKFRTLFLGDGLVHIGVKVLSAGINRL